MKVKFLFMITVVIVVATIGLLYTWITVNCLTEKGQPVLFACMQINYDLENGKDKSILFIKSENSTILVHVEIADELEERRRGLMFRENMDWNSGMLFIFENERILSFWMKNTPIPLDMLFIDDDFKIVDIKENAQPCLEELCPRYVSEKPAKYVLEVNSGFTIQNNIKIGDSILWK